MRKVNIPMTLACVLLCLTLISTHMTGGLFARYTTSAAGADSARVAKFDLLFGKTDDPATIICQRDATNSGAYTLTVTNSSEVAVSTTLTVLLDRDLEGKMEMVLKQEDTNYPHPKMEEKDGKFTYSYDIGDMAPNTEQVFTLTFSIIDWSWVTETSTDDDNDPNTETKILHFEAVVDAVQID